MTADRARHGVLVSASRSLPLTTVTPTPLQELLARCGSPCARTMSAAQLNRYCYCIAVDPADVRDRIDALIAAQIGSKGLTETHANLFSSFPFFVPATTLSTMSDVVRALSQAIDSPAYQRLALARVPEIAKRDPGSPGGVLGFDFHLSPDGPKLIEINTNPGGLLLNAVLVQAQHGCLSELSVPAHGAEAGRRAVSSLIDEWSAQARIEKQSLVAIVDASPTTQYLHAEFVLFQRALEARGFRVAICDPADLHESDGSLRLGTERIGFVYNRLTDFALEDESLGPLRRAYRAGGVALSPHPRAHALWADKRNLCLLGDADLLARSGLSKADQILLAKSVPRTIEVSDANRDALWRARDQWFFKPAAGYGSRASYRGDKLTRKTWAEMATRPYVAQALVPPGTRHIGADAPPLKVDIRCYAYRGEPLLFAARLYRGQTTNFRTPGGGFAPVLTLVDADPLPEPRLAPSSG